MKIWKIIITLFSMPFPMQAHIGLYIIILIYLYIAVVKCDILQREKRSYLLYPMGGQFKIVTALAMPIKLGTKQSMAFGVNLQFQYVVATNITQISEYPPTVGRRKREEREHAKSDRALAYLGIELIMNRYGIKGRPCLLSAICKNAMESLHHPANGLYGHLLHIFLTPDYGDNVVDTDLDPVYLEAQKTGECGVDCDLLYPDCPYEDSILDIISFLDNYRK